MNLRAGDGRSMLVEFLEPRRLLAVSLDANGWFNVTPADDTQIIYVSSSTGNDLNDGLSESTPMRTLLAAKALLRDNSADWMLLKRDDTFGGGFGTWTRSGRSADEPLLIGAYGTGDRPLLNTGNREGFFTDYGGNPVNNIALTGIHLVANDYDGVNGGYFTAGIRLLRQGTNYLIQDVKIEGYKDNIVLQGDGAGVSNIEINRVISLDAYNKGKVGNGYAQGLYAYQSTNGLVVERSVFDHNGWKEGVAAATIFNHDLYINTGVQNVIVRNNVISRGSNNGVLLRAGGTVQDNLFIRNSVGAIVDNTASSITGNVVLESVPVPGTPQGVGFNIETGVSAYVADNIIAHDLNSGTNGIAGISVNSSAAHVVVENNTIYDWRNAINNGGNRKITIRDNAAQAPTDISKPIMQNRYAANPATYFYSNNIYDSKKGKPFQVNGVDQPLSGWIAATKEAYPQWQKLNYVDPTRSIGSYNSTVGGDATTEAFLLAARNQSTFSWDVNYSAAPVIQYIREGFAAAAPTGKILGNVFDDIGGDGIRDGLDTSLGADITVYLDSNNDNKRQNDEPATTTDAGGNYSFSNLADGTDFVRVDPPPGRLRASSSSRVIVAGGATYAGRDLGLTDPAPPIRIVAQCNPQNSLLISLAFNTDVSASLDREDLQVLNLTTGNLTDPGLFTFSRSAAGSSTLATWLAPSLANGDYRLTLPVNSVSGATGPSNANFTYDFWVLNGDADRSRVVDIRDFTTLAANFGKSGQTFSQGNFDYSADGVVGISDFNILTANYGIQLDPLPTQPTTTAGSAAVANPVESLLADASLLGKRQRVLLKSVGLA